MRRKRLAALAIVAGFLAPALLMSDPLTPCQAPEVMAPLPLSTGAILDLVLPPMVENGISIVLLGALGVVGVPWILAGVGVALFHLPERFKSRR